MFGEGERTAGYVININEIKATTSVEGERLMYVTIVHVSVQPEHVEDFRHACRVNHAQSIKEPGNLRFDVLQRTDDPCRFVLYEAYQTKVHAAAHKDTAHYLTWRETVADWMAEPRQGITYNGLYPYAGE